MQRLYKQVGALVVTLGLALPSFGAPLGFDELTDGTMVTTQYAGLTFTNATAITAGVSLNDFEFPPKSGTNVVSDDGGPLELMFTDPVSSVTAYFTYGTALLLEAFDASNALLDTSASLFASNLAITGVTGASPNEELGFSLVAGISRVVITGDLLGGSFTLDDLSFERLPGNSVPEPGTLLLVALGLVGLTRRRGLAAG